MAGSGITFRDIQTWATRDFPDDFKLLPDAEAFSTQFNIVRGYNHDNHFKSLVVGSTSTKTGKPKDIIAWLAGSRIQIGYIGENKRGEPQIRPMTKDYVSVWEFKFPFNSILPTQSDTEVACFNAIVRYYFLAKGWEKGVIDEPEVFNRFVARFPYACRAVASAVGQRSGLDINSCNENHAQRASCLPTKPVDYQPLYEQRSPYVFEQVADDPLPDQSYAILSSPSPSPPPVRNEIASQDLHTPLEMHADTSVQHSPQPQTRPGDPQQAIHGGHQVTVIDVSNNTDKRDESGLRKKVFDLNIRLMIAESLARKAETAARVAQEEAELWRKRYEEAKSYKIEYEEFFGPQR